MIPKCSHRIIEKFHAYLAYLMELGYDLAIQPPVNVSNNPGFEAILSGETELFIASL